MALIVQKFGGSCLYNDESVKNAARIIVEEKKKDKQNLQNGDFNTDQVRLAEELYQQINIELQK